MAVTLKDVSFDVNMSYAEILAVHHVLLHACKLIRFKRDESLLKDFCKRLEDYYYYSKF